VSSPRASSRGSEPSAWVSDTRPSCCSAGVCACVRARARVCVAAAAATRATVATTGASNAAMANLPPEMADMPPEFMAMIRNIEENLKEQGVDPEKLAEDPEGLGKLMEQMMGGGGGSGGAEMQGMMQNMMEQMMSKDVLSEPMKQMKDLYPPWFAAHGAEQSPDELKRYKSQYKIVTKLVKLFDSASCDPSKISDMMQEMQALGMPPPECAPLPPLCSVSSTALLASAKQ
jgi:peroxin-19